MRPLAGARWSTLGRLLRPDAARWLCLGALVATASALALAGPLVVRAIVDRAGAGADAAAIGRLALLFLAIAIATQVLAIVVVWYATRAAWTTTNGLRVEMARHVLGLDHEFHRSHTPGELIQRVDGDVSAVSDFLDKVVPKALGALLVVVGMVVVLAFIDWPIAIGMIVYIAISASIVVRQRHRAVSESSEEMGALARVYGGIEERLNAAEDLRSNGAANHVAWRFVEESTQAVASAARRERAFLIMWWFVQAAIAAGWVLVLVSGAWLVSRDLASLGTVFLLYQYVLLVGRPLEDVVHQLETVQKANGAMARVGELLAVEATIVDGGSTSPPAGALAVAFDDVHFDYGDSQPVLRGIDLSIAAGRSVGIVGRTGSGKTTCSRLVLRLIEATRGSVALGGVPIAEIPLAELRRRVALVPQEVELFNGTVRDNVTMFDDPPSDDAVIAALRQVGLDQLADAGIDRELGAAGAGLSAGEAQLLALARVWLRGPDLVVLDEATARVDPATEQRLGAAVAALIKGRTALIIAHRLSTLHAVDDIVVFDHGRVVEAGSRVDLLGDDDSRYRHLLTISLEREEAGGPQGREVDDHETVMR